MEANARVLQRLNQDKQPNDLTLSSAASCLALPKSTCAHLSFTCLCKWTLGNFGVALPNTAVWVCAHTVLENCHGD